MNDQSSPPVVLLWMLCWLFASPTLWGQFTVSATTEPARCGTDGRISVTVTGGSGDYNYLLQNDCGGAFAPQQNALFQGLPACTYQITVVDRQDNSTASTSVNLTSSYQAVQLSIAVNGCAQEVVATGGRPPISLAYSDQGLNGPFQPMASPVLPIIDGNLVWVQATDACGRSVVSSLRIDAGTQLEVTQTDGPTGIQFSVAAGEPPYRYELQTATDTVSNATGFFAWSEIDCDAVLKVQDQCPGKQPTFYAVQIPLEGEIECVDFAQGSAQLNAVVGNGPFRFRAQTETGSSFLSETGAFTGLPVRAESYAFTIIDACGNEQTIGSSTPYRMDFASTGLGCTDQELDFVVARECIGEVAYPLSVRCLSCPGQEEMVLDEAAGIQFQNGQVGNWEIQIEDNCGDQTICRDTLVLDVLPACDSIIARVAQRFQCDDGLESQRILSANTTRFELQTADGTVLETNNATGVFHGITPGIYQVLAQTDCGNLLASTEVVVPQPISPYYEFSWYRDPDSTECVYRFDLRVERLEGPYVLTGGPNDNYYQLLDETTEGSCRFYDIYQLEPGLYQLTSTRACGSIFINLPEPDARPDMLAEVELTCPGRTAVRITEGLRTEAGWADWFAALGTQPNSDFGKDRFIINGTTYGNEIIRRLPPGTYTAFVEPYFVKGCFVDSIEFTIEEYSPLEVNIGGNFICEDGQQAELQVQLRGGNGPYLFREVDCSDGSAVGSELEFAEPTDFSLPNLEAGLHCFEVGDACGFNSGFEATVAVYEEPIQINYSCAPSVELRVDSLPYSYRWRDAGGTVLTNSPVLTLGPSEADRNFTLEIDLQNCLLQRPVELPGRQIIPSVTVTPTSDTLRLCTDTELDVAVITDAIGVRWDDGITGANRTITQPGWYEVEVINDLSCTSTDSFFVQEVANPVPQIQGPTEICPGDTLFLELDELYVTAFWEQETQSAERFPITDGGTFSVVVMDENGCQGTDSLRVAALSIPAVPLEGDSLICPDASTTVQTANAFRSYAWSNGGVGRQQRLEAGLYSLTVEADNGCFVNTTIEIQERPRLQASISGDPLVCRGNPAEIEFSLTGLDALSRVTLLNEQTQEFTQAQALSGDLLAVPLTQDAVIQLVSVTTEGYPCPVEMGVNTVSVRLTEVSGTIQIDTIPCAGMPGGALRARASSLSPPLTVNWEGYSSDFIEELEPGWYTAVATDQLGCQWRDSVFLADPPALRAEITALDPLCPNGAEGLVSIDAVANGVAPYLLTLNGQPVSRSVPVEVGSLSAGGQQLELIDSLGCRWDTLVRLQDPTGFMLDLGPDTTIRIGDTVQINPEIGFTYNAFKWTIISLDSVQLDKLAPILQPSFTSEYQLEVLSADGCRIQDTLTVFVDRNVPVYVPTAFSPNGDGQNDFFRPMGDPKQIRIISKLSVFSRFGNQLVDLRDLTVTDATAGWDGTFNGDLLPGGTYVWMATVELVDGRTMTMSGEIVLLR